MQSGERFILTGEDKDKGFMEDKEFEIDIEEWVKLTGRNGKVQVGTFVGKGIFVGHLYEWCIATRGTG